MHAGSGRRHAHRRGRDGAERCVGRKSATPSYLASGPAILRGTGAAAQPFAGRHAARDQAVGEARRAARSAWLQPSRGSQRRASISSSKAKLSLDYSRDEPWPSSTFSDSRKKRLLPVANIDGEVLSVEQANDEQADLTQAGLMQTDADLMRLHAEQMIGAAGAPSRVTAERRLRDSGLAAPRRLLLPANSDIDSIVFGCDLDGSHTDDAAESNQMVKQYSGLGTRSSQQTNQMDMSRRSTNHMTLEQLYGSEVSGVPPRDPRDFGQARGISSRAISEHLVTSSDITRRPLGVGSSAVHPTQAAHALSTCLPTCLPAWLPACLPAFACLLTHLLAPLSATPCRQTRSSSALTSPRAIRAIPTLATSQVPSMPPRHPHTLSPTPTPSDCPLGAVPHRHARRRQARLARLAPLTCSAEASRSTASSSAEGWPHRTKGRVAAKEVGLVAKEVARLSVVSSVVARARVDAVRDAPRPSSIGKEATWRSKVCCWAGPSRSRCSHNLKGAQARPRRITWPT